MLIKISEIDKKNNYYVYGGSKKEILDIKKTLKIRTLIFFPIFRTLKFMKNCQILIYAFYHILCVNSVW